MRNTQIQLMAEKKAGVPQKFYAIVGGLNGFNGVAVDWYRQGLILTQGVSNCRHQRFSNEAAARDFVARHSGVQADEVQVLHPAFVPNQQSGSETEEDEQAVAQKRADPVPAAAPQGGDVWPADWREEWLSDLESGRSPFFVNEEGLWGDGDLGVDFEGFCEVFDISRDRAPDVWTRVFNYFHKQQGGVEEQGQK